MWHLGKFLMCFQQISRLNQEVSQLSQELRHMMGLLQARLGSPSHPIVSAWPSAPPCPQLRPPCISPCLSGPPPSLQDTTLAEVHCQASVGTAEMGNLGIYHLLRKKKNSVPCTTYLHLKLLPVLSEKRICSRSSLLSPSGPVGTDLIMVTRAYMSNRNTVTSLWQVLASRGLMAKAFNCLK